MKALLTIGRLLELEVLDPETGRCVKRRMRGKWLAWNSGKRDLVIVSVKGRGKQAVPADVAKAHKRFHQAPPQGSLVAEAPEPSGALSQIGLLRALVYDVPTTVRSPEKNPHQWHHAFGDTGHNGGDSYPQRVMPALCRDARGNLFIKRRKGNIYTIDTWMRG